jgi:NADH dehydrogenase
MIGADGRSPLRFGRIVIIGGGFAGLACARGLARAKADVKLIDRRNFHLFQPLLYQVATGALSPANIAAPLRSIFRRQKNCQVLLAEVAGFNTNDRKVELVDGTSLPYDYLVIAPGSTHHYFGQELRLWKTLQRHGFDMPQSR